MLALKLLTYADRRDGGRRDGGRRDGGRRDHVAAGKDRRRSQLRLQVRMGPQYILLA
jgi:hypothetical protein